MKHLFKKFIADYKGPPMEIQGHISGNTILGEVRPISVGDSQPASTWACENHPPGLEIRDIPEGEACPVCGRTK